MFGFIVVDYDYNVKKKNIEKIFLEIFEMELLFFVYLKPRYDMIFVVMNFRKEHVMYHYMYHYGSPAGMVLPTVYLLIFAGALFVAAVEYIFL